MVELFRLSTVMLVMAVATSRWWGAFRQLTKWIFLPSKFQLTNGRTLYDCKLTNILSNRSDKRSNKPLFHLSKITRAHVHDRSWRRLIKGYESSKPCYGKAHSSEHFVASLYLPWWYNCSIARFRVNSRNLASGGSQWNILPELTDVSETFCPNNFFFFSFGHHPCYPMNDQDPSKFEKVVFESF